MGFFFPDTIKTNKKDSFHNDYKKEIFVLKK